MKFRVFTGLGVLSALLLTSPLLAQSTPQFVLEWGSFGSEDGQFYFPTGIAVDAAGNSYVADKINHRIQKFDGNGQLLTKWGTEGTGDGQFRRPITVALDAMGYVYVGESLGQRLQKFTSDGVFVREFDIPCHSVAIDTDGNIYVTAGADYVRKFDEEGNQLAEWGGHGWGDGVFTEVGGIAVDSNGRVYVTDRLENKVEVFDTDGVFLQSWVVGDDPIEVAVDATNRVYVVGFLNHRVSVFNANGSLLMQWGSEGYGPGEFYSPYDIGFDASGHAFVAGNNRVQKFIQNPTPVEVVTWGRLKVKYRP